MDPIIAESYGYTDGEFDGFTGEKYYTTVSADIPEEARRYYAAGYSLGWMDGRAAARKEDTK